jgi:archaellum component FlaF (FlaF/FlaG flagellin family)
METAFVSVICVALMVIGGMTMARGFLSSVDNTSANMQVVSQRNENMMRTNISVLEVKQVSADTLEVHISNIGQTKLADFSKWDVIVHHMDDTNNYYVTWLPYKISSPGANEWTEAGIYTSSGQPEVFDPGILNPGEELVIETKISPNIKAGSENLVVVTTPNGVTVTKSFNGS